MSSKRKAVAILSGDLGTEAAALASSSSTTSSKRVKFDSNTPRPASLEGEDTLGDLDIEEQDRKRLEPGRKGRVYAAGYDSDSDLEDAEDAEEEDGVSEEEEKDQGKGDDEEDDGDDMFGVDGSDDEGGGRKKAKANKGKGKEQGKKRFLELGEIEGQEFGTGDRERGEDGEEFDLEMDLEDTDDEDREIEGVDFNREMEEERTPPTSPGGTVLRDENGEEERRIKKRKDKRTMGIKLEGFNMKTDMATGRFDEQGNYIENAKDPHAEHDKWLAGNYSKSKIRKAKEAKEKRDKEAKEREERARGSEVNSAVGCMKGLCEILERGESVMEALQRLGREAKKDRDEEKRRAKEEAKAERLRKRKGKGGEGEGMDMAVDEAEDESSKAPAKVEEADKKEKEAQSTSTRTAKPKSLVSAQLERLTSLSSALMTRHGHTDVYEEEYETLLRVVRRSKEVDEDWDPAGERSRAKEAAEEAVRENGKGKDEGKGINAAEGEAEVKYEYKWSTPYLISVTSSDQEREEKSKVTFGPFGKRELMEWGEAGYFGGEERERVVVRVFRDQEEGEGEREWKRWREVVG